MWAKPLSQESHSMVLQVFHPHTNLSWNFEYNEPTNLSKVLHSSSALTHWWYVSFHREAPVIVVGLKAFVWQKKRIFRCSDRVN